MARLMSYSPVRQAKPGEAARLGKADDAGDVLKSPGRDPIATAEKVLTSL